MKTTVFLWFRRACMHGWTGLFALLIFGCSADLRIPEGIILACDNDSDCPSGARCTLTGSGDESVCVTDGLATCGNGVLEANETCDDGQDNATGYGAPNRCNTTRDGYAPTVTASSTAARTGPATQTQTLTATPPVATQQADHSPLWNAVINGGSPVTWYAELSQYGTPGRCNETGSGPPFAGMTKLTTARCATMERRTPTITKCPAPVTQPVMATVHFAAMAKPIPPWSLR